MVFSQRYFPHIFLSALLFAAPVFVHAQSVSLTAANTTYAVNDSILVKASVQTGGQPINAIEGQASFSPGSMSVSDIRYGSSIISLWVKNPTLDASAGTIDFIGGVPGGFSGSSGNIFTFILRPKKEGTLTVDLTGVKVLLNDGSGGELQGLKIIPLTLEVTKAVKVTPPPEPAPGKEPTPVKEKEYTTPVKDVPEAEELIPVPDTTPPEDFIPMVTHHESVADDAYFVAFFAVDKDSGVSRYEVKEQPRFLSLFTERFGTQWKEAKSPHVLAFQTWGSVVYVKAIDGAGNIKVSKAIKPFGTLIIGIFVLFLILATIIITRIFTKRHEPEARHFTQKA